MRKLFISALTMLAVAMGFTACSSDDNFASVPETSRQVTVYATTEHPSATRTALGEGDATNGYPVLWSAGDKIRIGENEFTLIGDGGTSTGEFTGTAPDGEVFDAYYPSTYDGETWPTEQTYVAGNIPTGVPMHAEVKVDGSDIAPISFKNVGGILRLNFKLNEESPARSISKVVVSSSLLDKDIVLNCATAVELTKTGVPFHIAVPAKEYTDLKFTIYDNTGFKCTKTLSSGKTFTVERSKITNVSLTAKSWEYAGLCFTAQEDDATVTMVQFGADWTPPTLEYSTDMITWTPYNINDPVTLAKGGKVYFRATKKLESFSTSATNYVNIKMDKPMAASGNVMSLIDPTCASTTIPCTDCFYRLFSLCTKLTAAPELSATNLAERCYNAMFSSCSQLTAAPELPAKILVKECYTAMFSSCTNLTAAPELSATNLAEGCYNAMFRDCTKLTAAPELSAKTLAKSCYENMFNGCTNLTAAPELSATNLAEECYNAMFNGCTNLTTAPELPATTLAKSCYYKMFNGCKNLTTAPELPAKILVEECYASMFAQCSRLTSVTCLATDINATNCVSSWLFSPRDPVYTLYCAPGYTSIWSGKVPKNWTVEEKK